MWTLDQLKIIVANFREKYESPIKVDYSNLENDMFEDFTEKESQNFSIFKEKEAVFKGEIQDIEKGDLIGGFIEVDPESEEEIGENEKIEKTEEIKDNEEIQEEGKKIEDPEKKKIQVTEISGKSYGVFGAKKPLIRVTKYIN